MATTLPTPSILSIKAFDAELDKDIEFYYIGAQPVKNRAIITDNETLEIIYDSTISALKLVHTIPAHTLTDGKQYTIQIQVFDIDGNSSDLSEEVLFYCYSTPYFDINIPDDPYKAASIEVILTYAQDEGESLKSYQYQLCDYNKNVITQSDILYTYGTTHTFYGLENNTEYYIRCIGESTHGFNLDSGYKLVNVLYNTIPANILFQLENHRCSGYISIDTNMAIVGYDVENDNYYFEDGAVTLWDNSITYKDGFTVEDDFVLFVDAKKLPVTTFLKAADSNFTLRIMDVCGEYYCEFKLDDYVIYKPLPKAQISTIDDKAITDIEGRKIEIINTSYEDNEFVIFEVKRIGNLYSLNVYYKVDGL